MRTNPPKILKYSKRKGKHCLLHNNNKLFRKFKNKEDMNWFILFCGDAYQYRGVQKMNQVNMQEEERERIVEQLAKEI